MSMMDLQGALGGGPPAEAPAPEEPDPGTSSVDFLDDAETALHQFIQNDPDEVDRAEAGKALQIVLKLKASNQTSAEAGDMKSLRRALAPGPAAAAPAGGAGPYG